MGIDDSDGGDVQQEFVIRAAKLEAFRLMADLNVKRVEGYQKIQRLRNKGPEHRRAWEQISELFNHREPQESDFYLWFAELERAIDGRVSDEFAALARGPVQPEELVILPFQSPDAD